MTTNGVFLFSLRWFFNIQLGPGRWEEKTVVFLVAQWVSLPDEKIIENSDFNPGKPRIVYVVLLLMVQKSG